jgi:hypothetical protein
VIIAIVLLCVALCMAAGLYATVDLVRYRHELKNGE